MKPTLGSLVCAGWLLTTWTSSLSAADPGELWLDPRCEPLSTQLQGPFVRLGDGRVLAIDSASSYVSSDGGATWSEPRPLFAADPPVEVSKERSLFRTKEGTLIAGFMNLKERKWTWKNELHDAPGATLPTYVMRSMDDGLTWTDVQKLHDDWTGAVRDMIQTREGRVIFTSMKMRHDPGRHSVLTYSSVDEGKSWKPSNLIDLGGRGHHGGVTEPTLTELKDGRIWMLIRTNWGEFWSAHSADGGRFWRTLQPSGIPASSAPGLVKRLASGKLMLLWNRPYPDGKDSWPLSGGDGLWSDYAVSNHREELSLAFSSDDGATWSKPVVLARQTGKWLAYPYAYEHQPGEIWVTTMQGDVRIKISESDFAAP
ncbi:MAG: exo-alpha-sialidase [Planctomycetales bacterium]|nr:exo-alpha-sialidase [Planctomycetales bacterium]